MPKNLKTISQSRIKELLKQRLENPEKFVDKPLVIWRSYFYDGIIDHIAWETRSEYNKGKPKEEWKWFCADPKRINKEKLSFCILSFDEDDDKIRENYSELPMVLFVPFDDNDGEIRNTYQNAEEYLYQPDFKELEQQLLKMKGVPNFLVDFLKAKSDDNERLEVEKVKSLGSEDQDKLINHQLMKFSEGESTYRWYNYFNYSGKGRRKGCDFPSCWFETFRKLKIALKLTRQEKFSTLSDLDFKYSFSHRISDDLKEEFRNYIIQNNL